MQSMKASVAAGVIDAYPLELGRILNECSIWGTFTHKNDDHSRRDFAEALDNGGRDVVKALAEAAGFTVIDGPCVELEPGILPACPKCGVTFAARDYTKEHYENICRVAVNSSEGQQKEIQ